MLVSGGIRLIARIYVILLNYRPLHTTRGLTEQDHVEEPVSVAIYPIY